MATEYEREQEGGLPPAVAGMWAFGRSRGREREEEALPRQYMGTAEGGVSMGLPKYMLTEDRRLS